MGQQETSDQAAAHLGEFFAERVAEFIPTAQANALRSPALFTGWLYRAASDGVAPPLGPIDEGELLFVASLGVPALLGVLLDKRQPVLVTLAARDALAAHFLADSDVRASVQLAAEGLARRAVRHLATQQEQLRRAERQSLYGDEHSARPVVLTPAQLAAVDDTAGLCGASA